MKRIWFFHLLNDYSGSPRVLSEVVKACNELSNTTSIIVSSNTEGALSDVECTYKTIAYRWSPMKWLTLLRFLWVQLRYFFVVFNQVKNDDLVYVNTLLPFGAALAAKLRGVSVVYHLHEPQVSPVFLFRFLKWVCALTSFKVLFVSGYLANQFPNLKERGQVLYNANSKSFENEASKAHSTRQNVLMLGSLKTYKGVLDFLAVARLLPKIKFELVLNCSEDEKEAFMYQNSVTSNVNLYSATKDVHLFYRRAFVTLNLSHPDKWIESFGLTIIESFQYGVPVIAPMVGGPIELIQKTHGGICIHHTEYTKIADAIQSWTGTSSAYKTVARKAALGSKLFTSHVFRRDIQRFVKNAFRIME